MGQNGGQNDQIAIHDDAATGNGTEKLTNVHVGSRDEEDEAEVDLFIPTDRGEAPQQDAALSTQRIHTTQGEETDQREVAEARQQIRKEASLNNNTSMKYVSITHDKKKERLSSFDDATDKVM